MVVSGPKAPYGDAVVPGLDAPPHRIAEGCVAVGPGGGVVQRDDLGLLRVAERVGHVDVDHRSSVTVGLRRSCGTTDDPSTSGTVGIVARPRGARARATEVVRRLAEEYPDAQCALVHRNPFELLVATILSAQSTDVMVNTVTPALFERYPTPADLAAADVDELEGIIHSTGFFHAKARSLVGMAAALEERFGGEVPTEMDDLVTLPGVGRKTANVVRSVAFGLPGLPVDTHVKRLVGRLRLSSETDPDRIEADLNGMVPPEERGDLSLRLIQHGRLVCDARRPRCDACALAELCPSAFRVGQWAVAAPAAKKGERRGLQRQARG